MDTTTSNRVIENLLDQVDDLKASAPPAAPCGKITIGYWAIRGLAAPLRMMAAYAGADFEAVNYMVEAKEGGGWDTSAWFDKKPALKARNAIMNLPYVIEGDTVVTQSNACLSFLGRRLGLYGRSEAETINVEQILCELMDVRNNAVGLFYSGKDDLLARIEKHAAGVHGRYEKLELWLQQRGTAFFAADTITAADFHAFELLDQYHATGIVELTGEVAAKFPLLAAFHARVRALPQLADYFAGELYALPMNNKMAGVGGTPDAKAHLK